jgi:hypothetical protein
MPGRSSAEEMPRLDAFDQEFGREPVAIVRGQRRKRRVWSWALVCIALGAGVIGALALTWPYGDGPLRFELQSATLFQRSATREDSDEQIDRLRREVDALKKEISELNEAQRQADETIATLKEDTLNGTSPNGIPSAYWYSNLAALHFKVARSAESRVAVPPPGAPESRDAATSSIQPELRGATPAPRRVRREPRESANGGNGAVPLSLEAPQQ